MSQAAYSSLKAAWHTDAIAEMRQGQQIVPRQVQLIISDLCNQDCHFCSYRSSTGFSSEQFGEAVNGRVNMNPNRMISLEKAKEILEDCADLGVNAIQFTGGGEPTVHPHHLEIFKHAQDLGLETSLVTNGVILRKGWENIYSKMKWIRVSIDAGTAETYASVRRVPSSQFEKALANLSSITQACSETLVGAGYVITRENDHEIVEGVRRLQNRAAYVRLAAMFSKMGAGHYEDVYEDIKERITTARDKYETATFKVVDLFGDRIDDLVQNAPDYKFCGYQQFNCYIGANLKVYRCCTTSYTPQGEVGDLTDRAFAEWFDSDEKFKAYEEFDASTCQVCQFNDRNRTINYLLQVNPLHVNFV